MHAFLDPPRDADVRLLRAQLLMPVMANNPSDLIRTALLRLTGTMIRSIKLPTDRIFLYEQVGRCTATFIR